MLVQPFEYHVPGTVEEALQLLAEFGDKARILAGGQSLIPLMKMDLTDATHIVDIKRIRDLSFIRTDSEEGAEVLNVGPLARHADIEKSSVARQHVPLLSEAAAAIGHPLVRNRGTIGGSLAQCYPTADLCVTALTLGARISARSRRGSRTVTADEFFVGPMTSALEPDEMIDLISIPLTEPPFGWSTMKFTLGHADFPLIVVSTMLREKGGEVDSAVISVGGLTWRPVRVTEVEEGLLAAGRLTAEGIRSVTERAVNSMALDEDLRLTESYKRTILSTFIQRSVLAAVERSSNVNKRRLVR